MCAKIQINMVPVKIQRYKKSDIMLENTKKNLHIRPVKQRHRKKMHGTKTINL